VRGKNELANGLSQLGDRVGLPKPDCKIQKKDAREKITWKMTKYVDLS